MDTPFKGSFLLTCTHIVFDGTRCGEAKVSGIAPVENLALYDLLQLEGTKDLSPETDGAGNPFLKQLNQNRNHLEDYLTIASISGGPQRMSLGSEYSDLVVTVGSQLAAKEAGVFAEPQKPCDLDLYKSIQGRNYLVLDYTSWLNRTAGFHGAVRTNEQAFIQAINFIETGQHTSSCIQASSP